MKRLAWLVFLAAAAWAGWQIHTRGVDGAFGGALAGLLEPIDPIGVSPDDAEFQR